MDEIPDDIMQAVGKALGPPDARVNRGIYAATCLRVSWALMAEREAATKAERDRCASVAQKLYDDWNSAPYVPGPSVDEPPTAMHAANAIRSGARP